VPGEAGEQWQASGRVGVLKPELPPLDAAIEKFLEEAKTRNLAAETIRKRREFLEGKLLAYCNRKGYRHLRDLTVDRLRDFRHGWKYSPLSAAKRLEYLRAFCRFCVEAGWMERNPPQPSNRRTCPIVPPSHSPTMTSIVS
jgi:site-specific recombinase XerD